MSKKIFSVVGVAFLTAIAVGGASDSSAHAAVLGPKHTEARSEAPNPDRMDAQNEFSTLGYDVLMAFPDDVVDFVWDRFSGSIVVLPESVAKVSAFVGKESASVVASREDAIVYLKRSETELKALDSLSGVYRVSASAAYDPGLHVVSVTVNSDDLAQSRLQVANLIAAGSLLEIDGARLVFSFVDEGPPRLLSATQGGEAYGGGCTGGFMARRVGSSTYGVITADHCTVKPTTYDGDATGISVGAVGGFDLRFTVLSGGTPENKIRIGSGSNFRTITSTGIVTTFMAVEYYGKVTKNHYGEVTQYKGCNVFIYATYCGLYIVTPCYVDVGDSGGPVYWNNTAYGTLTGCAHNQMLFTPISYVGQIPYGSIKVRTS